MSEISLLIKFQKWAKYSYTAVTTDPQLADMKILKAELYEARVVMGYDSDSNSIIASFKGTS